MTLTEFLRARNDELGENADRIHLLGCGEYVWAASLPCDCGEPARVLAECQARRAIIEHLSAAAEKCPEDDWPDSGDVWEAPLADQARHLLRLLATSFKDHPDFDAGWLQD